MPQIFKIVLVGDSGVGKTNLLAYDPKEEVNGDDSFIDRHKATVGVEFASRTFIADDGARIKAQIWDTAGQERYRAITTTHYRRAAGAMLVYDVTNPKSLANARDVWLPELVKSTDDEATMLQCITLIGNKTDLSPVVPVEEHVQTVGGMGLTLSELTSAKSGSNVEKSFNDLVMRIYSLRKGTGRRSVSASATRRKKAKKEKNQCC